MTLLNALQARTAKHPYLARSTWLTTITRGPYESCFMQPTDTPDGCLLISNQTGRVTPWVPEEADLLADDWEVCAGIMPLSNMMAATTPPRLAATQRR